MRRTWRVVAVVAMGGFAVGCSANAGGENTGSVSQGKIIGTNDLTPVDKDGGNIPAKYRPLIDAFGIISMGCTATHVGDGLVLTAGHCFEAPSTRTNNMACAGTTVDWGVRKDSPKYMTSTCETVLAAERSNDRDYAIFRVSPVPPVKVELDFSRRPGTGSTITIFGHPQLRPLEWSKTCTVQPASNGNYGIDQFSHQCDTEPGSSGSTILDDTTLAVIGIHDGGLDPWNYGTYLAATPISEFVGRAGNTPPTIDITAPTPNATVAGALTITADAKDSDGSVAKVTFTLPDGTTQTDTTAPYSASWDSTRVANGAYTIKVAATDDAGATTSASVSVVVSNDASAHWSASGTPNMATVDNGTACTTLTVTANGDASRVVVDLSGRHDWRSILRGTLKHGATTHTVFDTGTFPAGQGTFSLSSKTVAGFSGSAAGDWTLCIIDSDAYNDTGTLTSWSVHD